MGAELVDFDVKAVQSDDNTEANKQTIEGVSRVDSE